MAEVVATDENMMQGCRCHHHSEVEWNDRRRLTAGQLAGGVHAGIVPRETNEDGAAILLGDEGLEIGLDVGEGGGGAHDFILFSSRFLFMAVTVILMF